MWSYYLQYIAWYRAVRLFINYLYNVLYAKSYTSTLYIFFDILILYFYMFVISISGVD